MERIDDIAGYVEDLARAAKAASRPLGFATDAERQAAVRAMAAALRSQADAILEANAEDMAAAEEAGVNAGLLDRLLLTPERIEGMAAGLEQLADLPDPVGRVLEHRTIDCGLDLSKVSVPLGLVAMVYEARPNVTADAAGICIRTGNACILRGGSIAQRSCVAIAHVLADALAACGLPREAVSIIETTDRAATGALMSLRGVVDVLIPRGGAGLIQRCVRESLVPVIETGTGNCHTYVHTSADFDKARRIVMNAKTQRVGVCNACESLLVDEAVATAFLPPDAGSELAAAGVTIHADGRSRVRLPPTCSTMLLTPPRRTGAASTFPWTSACTLCRGWTRPSRTSTAMAPATPRQSSRRTPRRCERFLREVDASSVYANASTRFHRWWRVWPGRRDWVSPRRSSMRVAPLRLKRSPRTNTRFAARGQVRP